MKSIRLALANIQFPQTPDESVTLAEDAIARASASGADIVCFPECFVPGYRGLGHVVKPADPVFLERAWSAIARAAARAERRRRPRHRAVRRRRLRISMLVIDRDGTPPGFQDKVQLDP